MQAKELKIKATMRRKFFGLLAGAMLCGALTAQAQIIKPEDLERYAKEKYGDKWVEAAANIGKGITLDEAAAVCDDELLGDGNVQGQPGHHAERQGDGMHHHQCHAG